MGEVGAAVTERDDRLPADEGGAGVAERFAVYRYHDYEGIVIYVGVSANFAKRHDAHRRSDAWFAEIAHSSVDSFKTEQEAREYERTAIAILKPRYNRVPGGGGRPSTDPDTHRLRATFSVSNEALALLDREAARTGKSKSAIVEEALRRLAAQEPGR